MNTMKRAALAAITTRSLTIAILCLTAFPKMALAQTPDTEPPEIDRIIVDQNGTHIFIYTSERLDGTNLAPASAFTITAGGTALTIISQRVIHHDYILEVSPTIYAGQTVVFDYADPTTGNDVNAIQDRAGNDLTSRTNITLAADKNESKYGLAAAPTNFRARGDGATRMALSWSQPEAEAARPVTGYRIEWYPTSAVWTDVVADTKSAITRYNDTELAAETTRFYRVYAINELGESEASLVASGTTAAAGTPANTTPGKAATILVSNYGRTTAGSNLSVSLGNSQRRGVPFTTGTWNSNEQFTLNSITLDVASVSSNARPTIWIYSGLLRDLQDTGTARPGAAIRSLSIPANLTTGEHTFRLWQPLRLKPRTTYYVVLLDHGSGGWSLKGTNSDAQDAAGEEGWSLGNSWEGGGTSSWGHQSDTAPRIRVSGSRTVIAQTSTSTSFAPGSEERVLWTSTLGVDTSEYAQPGVGTFRLIGFNDGNVAGRIFAAKGSLSNTTLRIGGATYTIRGIYIYTNTDASDNLLDSRFQLTLDRNVSNFDRLTLHVGGTEYPLSASNLLQTGNWEWLSNEPPTWSNADSVEVGFSRNEPPTFPETGIEANWSRKRCAMREDDGPETKVCTAQATDESGGTITYALEDDDAALFTVNDNGEIFTKQGATYDRESAPTRSFNRCTTRGNDECQNSQRLTGKYYFLAVKATDSKGASRQREIAIKVGNNLEATASTSATPGAIDVTWDGGTPPGHRAGAQGYDIWLRPTSEARIEQGYNTEYQSCPNMGKQHVRDTHGGDGKRCHTFRLNAKSATITGLRPGVEYEVKLRMYYERSSDTTYRVARWSMEETVRAGVHNTTNRPVVRLVIHDEDDVMSNGTNFIDLDSRTDAFTVRAIVDLPSVDHWPGESDGIAFWMREFWPNSPTEFGGGGVRAREFSHYDGGVMRNTAERWGTRWYRDFPVNTLWNPWDDTPQPAQMYLAYPSSQGGPFTMAQDRVNVTVGCEPDDGVGLQDISLNPDPTAEAEIYFWLRIGATDSTHLRSWPSDSSDFSVTADGIAITLQSRVGHFQDILFLYTDERITSDQEVRVSYQNPRCIDGGAEIVRVDGTVLESFSNYLVDNLSPFAPAAMQSAGLTATFSNVPESHQGDIANQDTAFEIKLALSEEPASGFSYKVFAGDTDANRESTLQITNATLVSAKRDGTNEDGTKQNRKWKIKFDPTSSDAISVTPRQRRTATTRTPSATTTE